MNCGAVEWKLHMASSKFLAMCWQLMRVCANECFVRSLHFTAAPRCPHEDEDLVAATIARIYILRVAAGKEGHKNSMLNKLFVRRACLLKKNFLPSLCVVKEAKLINLTEVIGAVKAA